MGIMVLDFWFKTSDIFPMDLSKILFLETDKFEYNSFLPLTFKIPMGGRMLLEKTKDQYHPFPLYQIVDLNG